MRALGFAVAIVMLATLALARSEGIYNPSSNAVGDYQGIDSNAAAVAQPTGKVLLVDATSHVLLVDAASRLCRAGGC